MKKLLLAPFLLGSLFSFSGELKAHPTRMDSGFEPSSKTPAQVRDDTNWLAVFGVQGRYTVNITSFPFKSQQACKRQSELLKVGFQQKFYSLNPSNKSWVINYHCMKIK